LDEADAKAALTAFGVPVPAGFVANSPQEAMERSHELGYPVALKGLAIEHKTEAGAVALNLKDAKAVFDAATSMNGTKAFLVEKMVEHSVAELIIGAARDPVFGLTLTVGSGGILVELLEDCAILSLPTTRTAITETISRLRIGKLINGYRGRPKGDLEAVVFAVAAAADYVVKNAAHLEELDINPLMVLPENKGVVAVDALIRRRR
jgi:acetyl-CoA synthetase